MTTAAIYLPWYMMGWKNERFRPLPAWEQCLTSDTQLRSVRQAAAGQAAIQGSRIAKNATWRLGVSARSTSHRNTRTVWSASLVHARDARCAGDAAAKQFQEGEGGKVKVLDPRSTSEVMACLLENSQLCKESW